VAHPTVDDHLHATGELAPCDDVGRLRRVAALADAQRYDDGLTELEALCHPEADLAVLAQARLRLAKGDAEAALPLASRLPGLDAAVVRAGALVVLGREAEAGSVLAASLTQQPSAVPDHYLDADRWLTDDALALEVLQAGVDTLGPVASLVRARAHRLAAAGRLDEALAQLDTERLADQILRGDLLAAAGRTAEARRAWQAAREQAVAARPTPAMVRTQEELTQRLEAP